MIIQLALLVAVALQFAAFIITISLIPKTKYNISWIALSIGFFIMAIRRLIEFIEINAHSMLSPTLFNSWLAVLISLMMFIASFYIRRIFALQDRIDKHSKENESKILAAIIQTQEQERQKFSKEVHDGLGPILASIKMAISAISTSDLNTSNQQIISNVSMQAESAIRSVQEVANNLNPQILHRFGLHKAIATFVDGMALNPTLQVEFISNIKSNRYDYPVELALYRIVGELITNTIRHAQASKIQISINEFDSYLKLIYTDNGIGFDTRMQDSKGLGMLNMHSRIKSLGGEIEIQTKPNNGFIAHVKVPFKAPMIDFNTHIND